MDIGEIVEIGVREIPMWQPSPNMAPAAPQKEKAPERETVTVPEKQEA